MCQSDDDVRELTYPTSAVCWRCSLLFVQQSLDKRTGIIFEVTDLFPTEVESDTKLFVVTYVDEEKVKGPRQEHWGIPPFIAVKLDVVTDICMLRAIR